MPFQHPSEEFVFSLCRRSFLSLWSYANPLREGSTAELCDVLVVCDPYVLIFSVKYSAYQETDNPEVGQRRWTKKTVDASVRQVYGAERNLARTAYVTRSDGQQGLPLPGLTERKVHRIAVGLGGRRLVPFSSGDYGKGFVHCFDDHFMEVALGELNTITDFIGYLEAREGLAQRRRLLLRGGEEDLLAVYLHRGRQFPEVDQLIIEDNLWELFLQNPSYQRRLAAEEVGNAWDDLIEYVARYVLEGRMEFEGSLSDNEIALRTMARESRFARRVLADALLDFRERARRREVRARIAPGNSGVTYVFFNPPATFERQERIEELGCRCFIARNDIPHNKVVVGIGINVERAPQGYAVDLIYISYPEWDEEHQRHAEEMRQDLGFFQRPQVFRQQLDEYPE